MVWWFQLNINRISSITSSVSYSFSYDKCCLFTLMFTKCSLHERCFTFLFEKIFLILIIKWWIVTKTRFPIIFHPLWSELSELFQLSDFLWMECCDDVCVEKVSNNNVTMKKNYVIEHWRQLTRLIKQINL